MERLCSDLDKAVGVNKCIGGFAAIFLTTKSFLHHDLFCLHTNHVVVESPPDLLFLVENKTIVVA
jgi:hypothetical protein